ncbi:hypothetical protein HFP57_09045 [Parasphingopyxis algicola]|uniref:hypothetical protein n=1 Tax=Parasphingopyxis algicola TaxID=2026624 RepID=UPI0015A0D8B9|nr:hypothetical protein [Parasphingopyxis algicola]QLC25154.1 hypothetical protein HFP57_09045 [Parasphingopyxis algicola]
MNKNIIIIAAAAIVAFLAVLLIPRLLDRDEAEAPSSAQSSEPTGDSGSAERAGPAEADGKDEAEAPAASARPANPALEAQLAEAVRQMNASGPIVIDELTTMTAARAQGNRIQYRYEISRNLNDTQTAQFRQFAATQNQQTICTRPETRELIDLGGEIEYVYYGPGDRYLFSTPITGC